MGEIYTRDPFRLVNPIEWSALDKCMLGAGVVFPYYVIQALWGGYFLANPQLVPFLDMGIFRWVQWFTVFSALLFVGVMLMAVWLRRTQEVNDLFSYLFLSIVGVPVVVLLYLYGSLVSSALFNFICLALMGFFLFEFRFLAAGILVSGSLMAVCGIFYVTGLLPHTPLFTSVPDTAQLKWWMVSQYSTGFYPLLLSITLAGYFVRGIRDKEEQITELSRIDALTGVWNRRYVMELFERELHRARRTGRSFSFIMVDLDHFKKINDVYGHQMGDEALKVAAIALEKTLRDSDFIGRYGGEEFAMVLPNCNEHDALEVAERCRLAIGFAPVIYEGTEIGLSASFGCTTVENAVEATTQRIIETADKALYSSKEAGRNLVTFQRM